MAQPVTAGIHHLGLTVRELKAAREFFVEALGFQHLADKPEYPASFVSDGAVMLTLWEVQHDDPTAFDRKKNIGLHHFALRLKDEFELDKMYETLAARDDVEIEFSPELFGPGPTKHFIFLGPGGLRMELVAPVTA